MIGKLLGGRYRIVEILASGGFGQTYIAKDTHRPGNPKCVVKHLKPVTRESNSLRNARRLFQAEAETLEQLGSNDQIPRLLAHFEENQEFYLVQEFIEGHPLSTEMLPGYCWSERQVVQLLQEVLGILEVVHCHGLIHRDIKPSNLIRRQQDNRLVLIDFGSVKQVWAQVLKVQGETCISSTITVPTTIAIGTPGYIPTEQVRGRPRPNSDIYALGIIGIQALTGLHPMRLPEDSETGELVWKQHAHVSDELASVLTRMVCYHFKDRYQTTAEVLQALQLLVKKDGGRREADPPRLRTANSISASQPTLLWSLGSQAPSSRSQNVIPVKETANSLDKVDLQAYPSVPAAHNQHYLLIGASITAALISMIASYTIFWQPRISVQKTLERIEALKVEGRYEECVNQSTKVPQNSRIYINAQAFLHECQLAQATQLAAKRNFKAAITEASKIPQDASSYPEAQQLIGQWSDSLLEIATKQYRSGNLNDAITIAEAIPKTSAVYQKAQGAIKQWNGDWEKNNSYLKAAKIALDEGKWQNAISAANKVIDLPYWQEKIGPIIQKAESKIAESKTTFTSQPKPSVTKLPTRTILRQVKRVTKQPTRTTLRQVKRVTKQPTRTTLRQVKRVTKLPIRTTLRQVTRATKLPTRTTLRQVTRSANSKPSSGWKIEIR